MKFADTQFVRKYKSPSEGLLMDSFNCLTEITHSVTGCLAHRDLHPWTHIGR